MNARSEWPIYLDHHATTPLLPEVVSAMLPHLSSTPGNPSSTHVYGLAARRAVDDARAQVAALIDAEPDEIVFTSGGTEANNLAIRGAHEASARTHVVTSAIEHPATSRPIAWLKSQGAPVSVVGVDAFCRIVVDEVRAAIDENTALVSVMHANNETGVVEPIEEIAALARRFGAIVHTDAAQSLGKIPVSVRALDVDLLSLAGHKLHAPKGVGALYVRRGTPIVPFMRGASHERGLRPGTENVASIVGLGVACALVARDLDEASARMRTLRDELFARLSSHVPGLVRHGRAEETLPSALSVRIPRARGTDLLAHTPEVAASTGSACHEGGERASAVIRAMGIDEDDALGTVRLTLSRTTTSDEIERASDALGRAWREVVLGH